MSFPSEEEAFSAYAEQYPEFPVFLIDTYDTLKSGLPAAIAVGKRLAERGANFGVRLDSGDIQYLTAKVRRAFDEAGLTKARISCSNDLDEYIIETLTAAGTPVNSWGVGTRLVTGGNDAAFTGVYKLAAYENGGSGGAMQPVMKFSDNPEKTTNPGVKQTWRVRDENGMFIVDVMGLDSGDDAETIESGGTYTFWHPSGDYRHFSTTISGSAVPLLQKRMEKGVPLPCPAGLAQIQKHTAANLASLDGTYKRLLNPHIYKVSVTSKLRDLKLALIKNHLG
jgi:nicotinate phosphoribosyltransferase